MPTGYPGLLMAAPRTADPAIVGRAIDEIAAACRGGQARLALTLLGRLVPEFEHNSRRTDACGEPPMTARPAVPFLDLKAQQARIAARTAPAAGCGAGALPVHPRARGGRAGGRTGEVLRREALRGGQFRHRCDPDRLHGRGHRPRRCGVPARLHLYRDRRGAAGAGRDAGVRRCRSAHLPDRSGASGAPRRRGAAGGQAAAARADRRRSVRPAGRLAGAERHRRSARGCSRSTTCAQSFGCTLHGRPLGAAADATATSFFPSKPLGAYGDGGALLTESDERAALYRSLRTHGEGTTRYEVLRTGMNGRLDSMQAAVLLAKLTVFADELASRERVARYYDSRLGNAVVTPARVPDSTSAWAIYADPAARCGDARARAGVVARGRRADGDLLSTPTASAAGLSRPSRRRARCRCRRTWRSAFWRCRSIPISSDG